MSLSKSLRRFHSLLAAAPRPPPLRLFSTPPPLRLFSTPPRPSPSPPPSRLPWRPLSSEAAAPLSPEPSEATPTCKPVTRCLIDVTEDTDFQHWVVIMKPPDPTISVDQIKQTFTDTLVQLFGSEDEARERIYSMSLNHFIAFGARIPEELSGKIKELPNVDWILPDSYVDEENNVFGILDIAYKDEEWERNNRRSRECWLAERMIRRIRSMEKYKHRAGTMRWRG